MSIDDLKSRLSDLPGVEALTMQTLGGREIYSIAGRVVGLPIGTLIADAEAAIRTAVASPNIVTAIPMPAQSAAQGAAPVKQGLGSFAASIRAMMDDARAGVAQARTEGLSKVTEAVGKLNDAKVATTHVAGSMAKTIADEADAVMSELGQISNDLGLEG